MCGSSVILVLWNRALTWININEFLHLSISLVCFLTKWPLTSAWIFTSPLKAFNVVLARWPRKKAWILVAAASPRALNWLVTSNGAGATVCLPSLCGTGLAVVTFYSFPFFASTKHVTNFFAPWFCWLQHSNKSHGTNFWLAMASRGIPSLLIVIICACYWFTKAPPSLLIWSFRKTSCWKQKVLQGERSIFFLISILLFPSQQVSNPFACLPHLFSSIKHLWIKLYIHTGFIGIISIALINLGDWQEKYVV